MSKFNMVALAIAAALASPAALAVNVTPTTPDVLPSNALTSNTVNFSNGDAIEIKAAATDNYLGRSTGYNIRVTLSGGAVFNTAITNTSGVANGVTPLAGETISVAGGGQVGDNSVTFSVVPAVGVEQGHGISIDAGTFDVKNVAFLANGGSLAIDVRVGDPVGGNELASRNGTAIATAKQYWNVAYSAPANGDIRIDVGSDSAKRKFSSTGAVNLADTNLFNAGSVSITANTGFTNTMGMDPTVATAPLILTGANFAPFKNGGTVTLRQNADCTGTSIAAAIASNHQSAAIPAATTVTALNAAPHVCFLSNGTDIVLAQDLSASLIVKQATKIDSPNFVESAKLLDLAYNGAVKYVWHFNPSSNASQESYLRITNTSATAGLFTIDSKCDDATSGGAVKFNLGAGRSVLLTSKDVEQGSSAKGLTGSAGACVADTAAGVSGKRRLTITGEVGTMEVQNFVRNVTSAGMVNTNVNNAD